MATAKETQIDPYQSFPSLKGKTATFTSSTPFTPQYVQIHTSTSSSSSAYTSRVQGKQILLENPARESRHKRVEKERKARRKEDGARKRVGVIGHTEAKQKGVWDFKGKGNVRYDTFLPIHHLWRAYMAELMGLAAPPDNMSSSTKHRVPNSASMHGKLVKADFHGCIITVQQSKNPSLINQSGIIIHETENMFKIVTQKNTLKMIPKENSIFTFNIPLYKPPPLDPASFAPPAPNLPATSTSTMEVDSFSNPPPPPPPPPPSASEPSLQFQLYGNQFRFRSADRASRKFKAKETIEL